MRAARGHLWGSREPLTPRVYERRLRETNRTPQESRQPGAFWEDMRTRRRPGPRRRHQLRPRGWSLSPAAGGLLLVSRRLSCIPRLAVCL